MTSVILALRLLGLAFVTLAPAGAAHAVVYQSQEPAEMRAGQKAYVDDGTCPAGQIKEVIGVAVRAKNGMSVTVSRTRSCVTRKR